MSLRKAFLESLGTGEYLGKFIQLVLNGHTNSGSCCLGLPPVEYQLFSL